MKQAYIISRGAEEFASAREQFALIVDRLQSAAVLGMEHGKVEGLLSREGMELMRRLLQGHLDVRAPAETREAGVRPMQFHTASRRVVSGLLSQSYYSGRCRRKRLGLDVEREERLDLFEGLGLGQLGEEVAKIGVGFKPVGLGGLDEALVGLSRWYDGLFFPDLNSYNQGAGTVGHVDADLRNAKLVIKQPV